MSVFASSPPGSVPSLRCALCPLEHLARLCPRTVEARDSRGWAWGPLPPAVTWDPGSLHPATLQPACCLCLYVQEPGVRSVCSRWGAKRRGGALGEPGRKLQPLLGSCSVGEEQSLVSACCGEARPGDSSAGSLCLRREARGFGG